MFGTAACLSWTQEGNSEGEKRDRETEAEKQQEDTAGKQKGESELKTGSKMILSSQTLNNSLSILAQRRCEAPGNSLLKLKNNSTTFLDAEIKISLVTG